MTVSHPKLTCGDLGIVPDGDLQTSGDPVGWIPAQVVSSLRKAGPDPRVLPHPPVLGDALPLRVAWGGLVVLTLTVVGETVMSSSPLTCGLCCPQSIMGMLMSMENSL